MWCAFGGLEGVGGSQTQNEKAGLGGASSAFGISTKYLAVVQSSFRELAVKHRSEGY